MKNHYESTDNRSQEREKAIKNHYFPIQSFSLFTSVKTCSIVAPQCVFFSYLVSKHPLFKRLFRLYLQKGSLRQNGKEIRMKSSMAYQKAGKYKVNPFMQIYRKEVNLHKERIKKAVDMMDNSPLRSKLTTYPQPPPPVFFILKKRRRMFMSKIAVRGNIIPFVIVMDFQLTIDSKLPL